MAQNSNNQIIQAELVENISKGIDQLFPPKDIRDLLANTEKIIKKVNKLQKKWEQSQKVTAKSNPEMTSKTGIAYKTLYNKKESSIFYYEIVEVISEAELFLEKVRKYFTGQDIKYTVGVSYYGKLYEYNLTLLDVLKNAVVGIDSKSQGLKMRLANSKSALIKAYGTLNTETKLATIEKHAQENTDSELYTALHDQYLKMKRKVSGKKVNEGELYETYRYFLAKGRKSFDPKSKADMQFFRNAIKRSMNSTSGRQGGDIDTSQVKFFNASFATMSNIIRTLKDLKNNISNFINKGNKKEFQDSMKKMFTKNNKDIESIERDSQKDAKNHIDKVINSIPGFEVI